MMKEPRRLLAILAHPDDESLGAGSTLAKYAAEGVETYLVCATRGERGWTGDAREYPGPQRLGEIRAQELACAAQTLGIRRVDFLDYLDGEVDRAPAAEAVGKIAALIREIRPQVAFSFGPDGVYGHPDHIAVSQFAHAACLRAADPAFREPRGLPAHTVSKFYYMVIDGRLAAHYTRVFGELSMDIDGVRRGTFPWEEWAFTTVIDGSAHWRTALEAVNCHRSQVAVYGELNRLPRERSLELWGRRTYYRSYSLVNGGRARETDFFEAIA